MAENWNYSGDPNSSELDRVRFEIGDTDENWPLLNDDEIQYAIDKEANLYTAAARCCEAIASKFSREADYSLGPKSVSSSQRAESYRAKARELRHKGIAGFYVGGVSKKDEKKDRLDPDKKRPAFERGMMTYRRDDGIRR